MTWFKVDDSFYDHPKVYDASDAAVALWTRAGSWAARNLTDGFVPTNMLARFCGDSDTAAKELCDRGLWDRKRGGFMFHDWCDYQPAKEDVERERQFARERQRKHREKLKGQVGSGTVTGEVTQVVTRDSRVSHSGSHGAPTRPDPSLSTSVGRGSLETYENDQRPPPQRCPKHRDNPTDTPCGPCGTARRHHEQWQAEHNRNQERQHRLAIRNCTRCDADGWRWINPTNIAQGPMSGPNARCDHTQPTRETSWPTTNSSNSENKPSPCPAQNAGQPQVGNARTS